MSKRGEGKPTWAPKTERATSRRDLWCRAWPRNRGTLAPGPPAFCGKNAAPSLRGLPGAGRPGGPIRHGNGKREAAWAPAIGLQVPPGSWSPNAAGAATYLPRGDGPLERHEAGHVVLLCRSGGRSEWEGKLCDGHQEIRPPPTLLPAGEGGGHPDESNGPRGGHPFPPGTAGLHPFPTPPEAPRASLSAPGLLGGWGPSWVKGQAWKLPTGSQASPSPPHPQDSPGG